MPRPELLGFSLDLTDCAAAAQTIAAWASRGESRVVLAANVHMIMSAYDDPELRTLLNTADMAVEDGRPLVWALRALGNKAEQVRGADLTHEVCRIAQDAQLAVGAYGSTPETVKSLIESLKRTYPSLNVAFNCSPPYREMTEEEDAETVQAIADSGASILFVGLGCPKQERWMLAHKGRVPCVMIGVGAAFDFIAGAAPEAPKWMQEIGVEWVFRLALDPRRLWKRYLTYNPRFIARAGGQCAQRMLRQLGADRSRQR